MSAQDIAQRRAKVAELTGQMSAQKIADRLGISRHAVVRDQRANREAAERAAAQSDPRTPHTGAHTEPGSAHSARTPEEGARTSARADQGAITPAARTVCVAGDVSALPQLAAQPRAHPLVVKLSAAVRAAKEADLAGWHQRTTSDHVQGALMDIVHLALQVEPVSAVHTHTSALQMRRLAVLLTKRADALEQRVAAL